METPIEKLPIYTNSVPYRKASGEEARLSVPLVEIPKGTLLFRGVQLPNPKKDEDPRLFVRDWLGYPQGERFCMTPTHNTFFYTSPYVPFGAHTVGEWFNAIVIYQTVKDLRLVAMTSPSPWTRGGKEIKAFDGTAPIQRCDKFDYTCLESKTGAQAKKEKELKAWDNCIHPDFAKESTVSGWMAIADYDSLDNFKEGLHGKDTTMGKYIIELDKRLPGKGMELLTSTYTDATNHRGFPEVVLFPWSPHPGKENQYTEAATEEDAADAIAEMSDRFNYLPIACITERGVLEAFTGDFKAGDLPAYATSATPGPVTRKAIDKYQSDYLEKMMTEGKTLDVIGNIQVVFDKRTGFYMMAGFHGYYTNAQTVSYSPYNDFFMTLQTPEEREKVLEYKVKYRSFDKEKFGKEDTLLDGSLIKRDFIFERPEKLFPQFKELELKLPQKLIPYIWEATETYQKNLANRKQKNDPRGAEEARRRAAEAREKIKESLAIIAKKKGQKTGVVVPEEAPAAREEEEEAPAASALPAELQGKQSAIPIYSSYEEAYAIGKAAIDAMDAVVYPTYKDGLKPRYPRPWEMNDAALKTTLKYIFEMAYSTCYLLCIVNKKPYLFKLEPRGMHERVRAALEQQIQEKGITDIDLDNTRIMQCILKPYSQKESTAGEWLQFLDNLAKDDYNLPNGVFVLGLTDSVMLRSDVNEPFTWFTNQLVKLPREFAKGYFLPIFSYSGHYEYDDIPIPNFDDVFGIPRKATGEVDVGTALGAAATTEWSEKTINKAVFRGGTTGCGSSVLTNMRLKLCSEEFLAGLENAPMLDVGITTITKQYKMNPGDGLARVNPAEVQIKETLTIAEQSQYKYIIHVDGNVHAYRLLKTMLTGSCILRVMSWYYSWAESELVGYEIGNMEMIPTDCHYIKVAADLSNLDAVLEWCLEHEAICERIGINGKFKAMSLLNIGMIYNTFVNLLNLQKRTALLPAGGGSKKPKGTRKQKKLKRQMTRKQKRIAPEEKLVLAEYRGGGIEDSMQEYIQSTMSNLWRVYLKNYSR
jgi:hypothetical protein